MWKYTYILPALFFFSFELLAKNDTPDFYKCTGKVGGEWNFGRGPNGCNAASFGDDRFVSETYKEVIFRDSISDRATERNRYMEELHAVLRDAAEYYIKKRKPGVSQAEIDAWKTGIMAVANQESYWSHYRIASDNKIKLMRGDVGHGHGLLQVDDRHHFPAVQNGTAWNLMGNITYSFDEFFTAWERAPSQSCVKSATNFTARIRSAWAAYNGGPSKICRWTNPNDTWARNDIGFNQKLSGKAWVSYIQDTRKPSSVDVACLIEKRDNCSSAPGEPVPSLKEEILYQNSGNIPCVVKAGTLYCMQEARDSLCLGSVSAFSNAKPQTVSDASLAAFPKKILDRHSTCLAFDPSLIPAGKMLQANTPINMRATPGGGLLMQIRRGEVAQVLDFEIRVLGENDRYYKITVDGKTGFIYGGSKSDYSTWAQISALPAPLSPVIARPGETFLIKNPAGINMRATPGGVLIGNVPAGTQLVVLDYVIRGSENSIYYQVSYKGKIGFLYSGQLLPKDSTASWTVRNK